MMAYRREGNDPTRHRNQSPAEVKAMLAGGGSAADYRDARTLADLPEATGFHKTSGTPEEVADEVMVWLNDERTMNKSRAQARRDGRCAWRGGGCGRIRDCCCDGCPVCPQTKMAAGKISMAWAKRQVALGSTDPREMC